MVTIEPPKRKAPKWLGYIITLMYILMAVFFMLGITNYKKLGVYFLVICTVIIVMLVIFNFSLSWYAKIELEIKGKYLLYNYYDIIALMGNTKSEYRIKSIDSFKRMGNSLRLYGNITVKEPLSKVRSLKYCTIRDISDEALELIVKFKEEN